MTDLYEILGNSVQERGCYFTIFGGLCFPGCTIVVVVFVVVIVVVLLVVVVVVFLVVVVGCI